MRDIIKSVIIALVLLSVFSALFMLAASFPVWGPVVFGVVLLAVLVHLGRMGLRDRNGSGD